jgi:hypothetical protein
MKKRCIPFAAVLIIGASFAGAEELRPAGWAGARPRVLPGHEILTIIRSTGFEPTGRPVQKGTRYEVDAIDPYDVDVRLVVDARSGEIIAVRDGAGLDADAPPLPGQAYAQAGRPFGAWRFDRMREARPVPPRDIPGARRSAALEAQTPLPRPRPNAPANITGATKPERGMPPVTPLDTSATPPVAPVTPLAASTAGPPAPSSAPSAGRVNPGEKSPAAPSGPVAIVPVAPLE